MGTSFEEMRGYLRADADKRKADHVTQLKTAQYVGEEISGLVSDPRWELYGRHINSLVKFHAAARDRYQAEIDKGIFDPQKYTETLCRKQEHAAAARAYETALTVAKTLIESGAKAAEELKVLANLTT